MTLPFWRLEEDDPTIFSLLAVVRNAGSRRGAGGETLPISHVSNEVYIGTMLHLDCTLVV
jgi:hypothetical protein